MTWQTDFLSDGEKYLSDDGELIGEIDTTADGRWSVRYMGRAYSDEPTRAQAMSRVIRLHQENKIDGRGKIG